MIPTPEMLARFEDALPRIRSLSVRRNGADSVVRFEPSLATQWVTVHVQHTGVGGGGATFNATTYVSRAEYDCRQTRIRDVTVTRNGTDRYTCWIIPVLEAGDGTRYAMDGQGGRDDLMTFADLGV